MNSDGSKAAAERARLDELHRLQILDTPAEPAFDKIVQLAGNIFAAPIALISLVDSNRQWFKASCGLGVTESDRDISFCTHAIEYDATFVVHDASRDPMFKDNPLVVGSPGIRFYAGAPLVTANKLRVGTLCIVDTKPRNGFRKNDREILESLASLVVDEMDLRLANRAVIAERERADAENRAKTDFVTTMCHEIRAPVFAITSLSALARSRSNLDEIKSDLDKIEQSGRVLSHLIDDAFDMSRIDTDTLVLDEQPFSLCEMIETAVTLLASQAAGKGIALNVEADADLPPLLIGDSTRLLQVIMNLASNAIKFTREGSVTISASVRNQHRSIAEVRIAVRDTGIGISEEQSKRVFDQFFKGSPVPSQLNKGVGLGLSISKRIVGLMGGQVSISSEPGSGSEFSFSIRMRVADPPPDRTVSASENDLDSQRSLRGAHVLLVDDDDISRQGLGDLLRNAGMTVTEARNGREAVDIVLSGSETPDAVLMDMQMPRMDGLEATRLIRERVAPDELPIIALTGLAFLEDRSKSVEAGMNDWLPKPVALPKIQDMLAKYIRRKQPSGKPATTEDGQSGAALRQRMLSLFRKNYGHVGDLVQDLARTGALESAAPTLHKLRGAAYFLDMLPLAEAADELEGAIRQQAHDRTATGLERFCTELARVMDDTAPGASRPHLPKETD